MSRRIVLVRHGEDPPDDRVAVWASLRGLQLDFRRPYRGEPIGPLDETVVGTVVYGGPFVPHDPAHTFLHDEHAWIEACMAADLPVLGICQGAQSIAHIHGARVGPPAEGWCEFGYYEIRPTDQAGDVLAGPLVVAQSHEHEFEIPPGGVRLAGSDRFENQAFRIGTRTYGLQFHPEVTVEGFRRWQNAPWARYHMEGAQTREEQNSLMAAHDAAQAEWFYGFLDRLFPAD